MSSPGSLSNKNGYRKQLKFIIMSRRRVYVEKVGFCPVCAVCGLPILCGGDMHEVLIPRKAWLDNELKYTEENCVLTHPGGKTGGCHAEAHTQDGYDKCVAHLVQYVGIDRMFSYLNKVHVSTKGGYYEAVGKLVLSLVRLGYERNEVVRMALDGGIQDA